MARATARYDQVDCVLDSWAQSHPNLDLSSKDVTLRIQQLAACLNTAANPTLTELGLKPGIFTLLTLLHRQGSPYISSPRRLAEQLEMSSGGMTNLLDRAEANGFLVREPDPIDGRSVIVQLTSLGERALEAALKTQTEQEKALLAHLTRREQATLTQLLRKLMCAAEHHCNEQDSKTSAGSGQEILSAAIES